MVLVRDNNDKIKCFSNVCTHRGNIVISDPGKYKSLTCGYHGRKFDLNGKFKSMPEFDDAKNFPRECDNLKEFQVRNMGPFLFVGLEPSYEIKTVFSEITERVSFIPLDKLTYRGKDYLVNCHWALYCDNYLEGFHIPFVHNDLNDVLDYGSYTTELFDNGSLQIGYSKGGEDVFNLPSGHPDSGNFQI